MSNPSQGFQMTRIRCLVTLAVACAALACAGDKSPVDVGGGDALKGLTKSSSTDSAGAPVDPQGGGQPGPGLDTAAGNPIEPVDHTPGYARGVVRGSEVVQGPDTLTNSVRIANVRVAAFPIVNWNSTDPQPNMGPPAAEVFTNANGEFQLPELTAGHYVVTFTPPANSKYAGVWVTGTISGKTKDYPWWVTLPNK
jgi:hypothetical protein